MQKEIYSFIYFLDLYIHKNSEVHTLDKPSDALCSLCLRPFNFTINFQDDKIDENKVVGNAHMNLYSPL